MPDPLDLDRIGVRSIPAAERITGVVALVIQPDPATIQTAYDLAAAWMPAAAAHVLGPGSLPHVTLTQCAVRDAPRERVRQFVARLEAELRERVLPLRQVVTFGAGFLFWRVEPAGAGRRALQAAHEDAVTLAEGLLDPVASAAVVEATARAFAGDSGLVANARTFGYALVREHYVPHITLGFDARLGADQPAAPELASRPHTMTVDRVVLAQLAACGRIDTVLSV